MLALIKVFVDIALWRKGPQDLPSSTLLLVLATVGYFGMSLALAGARQALLPPGPPAPQEEPLLIRAFVELILALVWIWLLLALFRRPGRFRQSATALMGIGLLISPVVLGANVVLARVGEKHPIYWPLSFALLVLGVWYLLVVAHILRSALETRLFPAIVLTLLYMMSLLLIEIRLFGMPS